MTKFTVETTAENLSLSQFLPWGTPVILEGTKTYLWDHYSYELTGWEILHDKTDKASGTPEMLNLLFEDILESTKKEMIVLHEADQEEPECLGDYKAFKEAQ